MLSNWWGEGQVYPCTSIYIGGPTPLNPLKHRKIKPPFCFFSYPLGGLRGLNFEASKRNHFKKWLKLVNKKGTISKKWLKLVNKKGTIWGFFI